MQMQMQIQIQIQQQIDIPQTPINLLRCLQVRASYTLLGGDG